MVRVLFILILLLETIFANSHTKIKDVNITEISKKEIPKSLEYNRSIDYNKWYKITINKKSQSNLYSIHLSKGIEDYFLSANIWHKNSMPYGIRLINFKLDNNNTKTIYLGLKTKPNMDYRAIICSLEEEIDSFVFKTKYLTILSIYFLMIGMIVMASLYSGTLYFYNRDKTFLYYSLMQFFMSWVLILHTNILAPSLYTYRLDWIFYYLALLTSFFATLFSYHFLKIKEYLPKYAKFFYLYLLLIALDMFYYKTALLTEYRVYSIAAILFIVVGFLRLRQGFKPAKFYIVGWIILDISIAWVDYFYNYQPKYFNPLFLGAVIEAIMFAFAISYMVKETNLKKQKLQSMLIHKDKLASLGELLGNIAHQWKQPLATIGYEIMSAKRIEDKKSRDNKLDSASKHIEFLSQTINDFQNFYAVSKDKESFDVFEEIKFVISMIQLENIDIKYNIINSFKLYSYKNEFRQVVLNIVLNAKEALMQNRVKNPTISITIDTNVVIIEDNGGGIKFKNINDIFKPYISSKKDGTGLGLYISKLLLTERLKGKIEISNSKNGAVFTLFVFDL